ncbi:MAG: hypothetical protein WC466_08450 [Candidatus Izemoplasmatales bacterium]
MEIKREKKIEDILKRTNLKTRFKVSAEMHFINLLSELGFRNDKSWSESENQTLQKLCDLAEKLSDDHIKITKEWFNDKCC